MGLPSELPVSAPPQGHEVYPLVSSHPQGWSRHRPAPARAFSEPHRLFGALGEIGQRGMPLQASPCSASGHRGERYTPMSTITMKNEITKGKATCCCFPESPKRMAKGPFDVESGSAASYHTIS